MEDLAAAQAVLKEFWGRDSIVRTCGNRIPLYAEFKQKNASKGDFRVVSGVRGRGLTVLVPVQVGYNHGYNIVEEGGVLPTARQNAFEHLSWPTYKPMISVQLTIERMIAAKDSEYAFAKEIATSTDTAERSVIERLAAQILADGTGFLAQVNGAVVTDDTLIVDNPGTRWMQRGQYIDIWTAKSAGSQEVDGLTDEIYIVDLDADGLTAYLSDNISCSNNSWVFVAGSPREEVMGLLGILSDGADGGPTSIAGFTRTTAGNSFCNAKVLDAGGEPFSEDTVQQVLDAQELGDYGWTDDGEDEQNKPDALLIGDFETRKYFAKVLIAQKRIMDTNLVGGAQKIDYDWFGKRVRFCWDKRAWGGRLQAVNPKSIAWYVAADWDWWDTGAGPMSKDYVGGTASVIGQMYAVLNLACEHFPSNAYIDNYDAPA